MRGRLSVLVVSIVAAFGCSTAYYSAWEAVGREKRDLLRSNVEAVQHEQQEAADEFESALDRLRALYDVDAPDLERAYDKLKGDLEDAQGAAADVRDRIDRIENVASDLFVEWEGELAEISSADLRAKSRRRLEETRTRFESLSTSLRAAESSMQPVLTQLNDSVLYLKHNLNAAAIGDLSAEVEDIEADIETLIANMRASIAEAETFLGDLPS